MKNKNRRAIIEKLKELDMEKTDFKALPFYSLLSFHDSWYKWFELASKAKKAAQLITMVKNSFVHSKHSFKTLSSQIKPRALQLFEMILPEPL